MYTSPQSNEKIVTVTRGVTPNQYSNALANNDRIVATGPCGSGKSSFSIAYLWKVSAMRLLVIQPDVMSSTHFRRGIRKAAKAIGAEPVYECYEAERLLQSVKGAEKAFEYADVVIVDDIHTTSAHVAAAVQLVREKAKKYILISATLSGDSDGALGAVVIKKMYSPHVSYPRIAKNGLDGTLYDPSKWPGTISKALVYPVSSVMCQAMKRFYKSKGKSTVTLPTSRRLSAYSVVLAMPGTDIGIDVDADLLIDSGYTARVSDERGAVVTTPVQISRVEQAQRWARLGRTNVTGIIVHPGLSPVVGDRAFSNYESTLIAIYFHAHGLSASSAKRLYGVNLKSYSAMVSRSVLGKSDLYGAYSRELYYDAAPRIFLGHNYGLPTKVLRMDRDCSQTSSAILKFGGSLTFAKAARLFNEDKRKYRVALTAFFFGTRSRFKPSTSATTLIKNAGHPDLSLSVTDINFVRQFIATSIEGKTKKITTRMAWPGDSGAFTLDQHNKSDEPQSRFAAAVCHLMKCDLVDVRDMSILNMNANLARFFFNRLRTQGIEPNPGPIHSSGLKHWYTKTNMTVVFANTGIGCRRPTFDSWKSLDAGYSAYLAARSLKLHGSVLLVHFHCNANGGDVLAVGDKQYDMTIAGFDVYPSLTLPAANVLPAVFSPVGMRSVARSHNAYWTDSLPAAPMVSQLSVRIDGLVKLPNISRAEAIYNWHCQHGHTVVAWQLEGSPSPAKYKTIGAVKSDYMKMRRRHSKDLVNMALVVYVDDEADGDMVLDNMRYDVHGYSLVPTHAVDLNDDILMSCHFKDGTSAEMSLINVCDNGVGFDALSAADSSVDKPVIVSSPRKSFSMNPYYVTGGADDDGPSKLVRSTTVKDLVVSKPKTGQATTTATKPTKKSFRLPVISGGSDDEKLADLAADIDLTSNDIMNAKPEVQTGKFFTKTEMAKLHTHASKTYGNAYYIALLHHFITSDASEKVDDTDKFVSGEQTFAFSDIFVELAKQIEVGRFTVRRYARSMAASLLPLWEKSDYFVKFRNSANNPLAGRAGLNKLDAIYATSFFDHLVPQRLKSAVNEYNSTRTIESDAVNRGTTKTFKANVMHASGSSNSTTHTRLPGNNN